MIRIATDHTWRDDRGRAVSRTTAACDTCRDDLTEPYLDASEWATGIAFARAADVAVDYLDGPVRRLRHPTCAPLVNGRGTVQRTAMAPGQIPLFP